MQRARVSWLIAAVALGCISPLSAQETTSSFSPSVTLQRDSTYEQYLHFEASADTAITPARVLRWICSLQGQKVTGAPSSLEFQPILRVRDSHKQIIAQLAFKF